MKSRPVTSCVSASPSRSLPCSADTSSAGWSGPDFHRKSIPAGTQPAGFSMEKLSDVFSDWHVPQEKRQYIPVVQELKTPEQKIVCILGSSFGYKDWIVKNEKM